MYNRVEKSRKGKEGKKTGTGTGKGKGKGEERDNGKRKEKGKESERLKEIPRKECRKFPRVNLKTWGKIQMYINNIELNNFNIIVIISCSYSSFPFLLPRKPKGNPWNLVAAIYSRRCHYNFEDEVVCTAYLVQSLSIQYKHSQLTLVPKPLEAFRVCGNQCFFSVVLGNNIHSQLRVLACFVQSRICLNYKYLGEAAS